MRNPYFCGLTVLNVFICGINIGLEILSPNLPGIGLTLICCCICTSAIIDEVSTAENLDR